MHFSRFFEDPYWEAVGLLGQVTFGFRFIYQWIVSERKGKSTMPVGFWWLSICGSVLIMIYAIHQASLTFMIPTLTGVPVYIRNLALIRRERMMGAQPGGEG